VKAEVAGARFNPLKAIKSKAKRRIEANVIGWQLSGESLDSSRHRGKQKGWHAALFAAIKLSAEFSNSLPTSFLCSTLLHTQ
jgi:hypothetical protein